MKYSILCATILSAISFAANSFAGQAIPDGKSTGKNTIHEPIAPEAEWVMNFRTSYTFESDFSRGSRRGANGDSFFKAVNVSRRFSLGGAGLPALSDDGAWYLRVGASYARWDFGNSGGLPIPNHLQSASADIALEYMVRGQLGFFLQTEPGIYFEDDVRGNSFDAPTKLALAYPVADNFVIVGGVSYTGLRSIQFIPLIGFSWTINDRWKVSMIPPEPRVIYTASDKLKIWAGGEIAGGSFRVDERETREKKSLNNAVLDYSELRAGAGFTYAIGGWAIELGGGYAFQRKFDYHRAEEGFETDEGAPYVKFQINGSF
jgi:Domain of unknown function (DUF6268)